MNLKILFSLLFLSFSAHASEFKKDQLRYPRVREAYAEKQKEVEKLLIDQGLSFDKLEIILRAYKAEKKLEVWGRNAPEGSFKLIKTYDFCRFSGIIGRKKAQGDEQIPEGFYHINRFNPKSNFYLSLGIDYPNAEDKRLKYTGGDIFIHGGCATIGCIPITDDGIKELYLLAVEAKINKPIAVILSPIRFSNFSDLESLKKYKKIGAEKLSCLFEAHTEFCDKEQLSLWKRLWEDELRFMKENG